MRSSVAYSDAADSAAAGKAVGRRIAADMEGHFPDVVIVFASARHDPEKLLSEIHASCCPGLVVGCSSAGEFVSNSRGEGAVSAVALQSDEMMFSAGLGSGLGESREAAARQLFSVFRGPSETRFSYRSALLLADALAGYTDELVEILNTLTGGMYQFVGGGAGDDARFEAAQVFFGEKAYRNAAVALEILSNKPIGIGVRHGWQPSSKLMRVTEADGMRLISLNGLPAAELYQEHMGEIGKPFDPKHPLPCFLHHVIGINTGSGYKLRVPLAIATDGALHCASDIPNGALVSFMSTGVGSAADAAYQAARDSVAQLGNNSPAVALFFDCVATRLRMGSDFDREIDALKSALGGVSFGGCNSYGQIARVNGQFSGFHNCTAVVCTIPK